LSPGDYVAEVHRFLQSHPHIAGHHLKKGSGVFFRALADQLQHPAVADSPPDEPVRISWSTQPKKLLAAVIHPCGAGAGQAYSARNFQFSPRHRCGDHDVTAYLARIYAFQTMFAKPAAGDKIFEQGP
jgi:hypothetical protein